MKLFIFLFLFIPFVLFSQERFLTVSSKDSIDNKPKFKSSLGVNMKLNGYYDVFGGLQDSETFNIGNINVFGTDDSGSFKMDLYQTQIKLDGVFVQENGQETIAVVEFDFWGGNGHMRLRKAYVETAHWQIGQNWNNFGDEVIWPNIMEWEGPPSGIWTRSPHIKYFNTFNNKKWKYEFSLEAPKIDYTSLGELEPLVEEANQVTPDFTAALKNQYSWGHIRLSSILRNIRYKFDGEIDNFIGYGFALSGIYKTEKKNNLQFQIVGGKGITAYLTSVAGLGFDGYPTIHQDINATPSIGGWLSYEYFFTEKFHSNIVFGYTGYGFADMERFILANDIINEDAILRGDYFYRHTYGIFNLLFEPFERMTFGLELNYGVKNLKIKGYVNDVYIDDSKERDAMRISFGFIFYI
ncbi:MAG: hypothetical protein GQ552_02230 [Flavobacteriaceae bacterium]|nr:hypothetical protein [Flavobacteriaceae bacterium]